jgi:hypothetical protein
MKRFVASVVAVCVLTMSMACHSSSAPVLPASAPSAKLLQYEQTAVAALNAVSAAAIAANSIINPATNAPLLSNGDTNTIVTGIAKIDAVITAAQTGWPAALTTAWASFQSSLNATQKSQLAIVLAAGDVAVAALVAAAGGEPLPLTPQVIDTIVDMAKSLTPALQPERFYPGYRIAHVPVTR